MWPLDPAGADLASLAPGETRRQEVDWMLAEWLPPGEYTLRVQVREKGRPLPRAGADLTPREAMNLELGKVEVRWIDG